MEGTSPNSVAELLGDRVETLLRTYAHVTVDHHQSAVDDLERALNAVSLPTTETALG